MPGRRKKFDRVSEETENNDSSSQNSNNSHQSIVQKRRKSAEEIESYVTKKASKHVKHDSRVEKPELNKNENIRRTRSKSGSRGSDECKKVINNSQEEPMDESDIEEEV